ncbi:MAG: bifunctional UDP-N-acetylglucosamine diphosphorylase/glucosamine-1-phosphate N-acetyltransferase GlmU [Burkholderiales bacterium]
MNIVILAAGHGSRMRSNIPKVLHRLGGRALLDHVLESAFALAPQRVCVVYGYGGEIVPDAMRGKFPAVLWAKQEPQLGTGHAVMQALPHLDPLLPTLILYGDVPLISVVTLRRLVQVAEGDLAILTVNLDNPKGYGRILRVAGEVVGIVEEKDANETQRCISEINTGVMVAPTAKLKIWLSSLSNDNAQGEYYLTDVVAKAKKDGVRIGSAITSNPWETSGVNTKVQLAELEHQRRLSQAQTLLDNGVTLLDPARTDVRGKLTCGQDCEIDVNCIFEGDVVLGDRVVIGANCILRNVTVAADTRIEAFCHLDSTQIGSNCRIGPYARLRPGANLAKDVHIGNFVEVKASSIGEGSKANHLSYIGDSEVGRNVNVGAGTITCNYDGVNKHRTIIEDDVFIGSDSQLVAPIRVGKGATLGAGTTLTKDAPEGKLTLSRSRQTTIDSWSRPKKKS